MEEGSKTNNLNLYFNELVKEQTIKNYQNNNDYQKSNNYQNHVVENRWEVQSRRHSP